VRTLLLVRHAKSSWDDPLLADRERPLNGRGRRDAPKMGERLARRGVRPDLILASPAERAITTARILAKELDYDRDGIVVDDRLYAASVERLLKVIAGIPDRHERVLLVGHNPELSALAHRLTGEFADLPTCAVVELAWDAPSWAQALRAQPARASLETPR